MSTRSTQLAAYRSVAAETKTVFTCPVGQVVIVKSVMAQDWGAGGTSQLLHISSAGTAVQLLVLTVTRAVVASPEIAMWLVMKPGDRLDWNTYAANVDVVVSGTILEATGFP